MYLSHQVFNLMPKLRFLIIHNDPGDNKLKFPNGIEFLPNKLILLCWTGYPFKSLPRTFTGEHLVQIKMPYSKLTKLAATLAIFKIIEKDGEEILQERQGWQMLDLR